jgi:hypothetical protein
LKGHPPVLAKYCQLNATRLRREDQRQAPSSTLIRGLSLGGENGVTIACRAIRDAQLADCRNSLDRPGPADAAEAEAGAAQQIAKFEQWVKNNAGSWSRQQQSCDHDVRMERNGGRFKVAARPSPPSNNRGKESQLVLAELAKGTRVGGGG